uniref:DnaJ heat shock protein family (Hsp40) member C30 n=1 Tax=Maylandia zebra TaxID=106582 RepID=A0A3P9BEI7_9CICH
MHKFRRQSYLQPFTFYPFLNNHFKLFTEQSAVLHSIRCHTNYLCHSEKIISVHYKGEHHSLIPADSNNTLTTHSKHQSPYSQHLYWQHGQRSFIRAYSGDGARSEPLYKTKTGYYDILEVAPSATRTQIKTAYYKQSFTYHPDRNTGSEEATVRFSEISEAYTVLGNKGLRKKYDLGLLSLADLTATVRPSVKDTSGSAGRRQTDSRRSVVDPDGRGGIFDFDQFYKSHYSEQLQRQRDIRVRKEEILKKKQDTIEMILPSLKFTHSSPNMSLKTDSRQIT